MAMLLLACADLPDVEVATVNHGLRPEAVGECALVVRICAELAVPCTVIDVSLERGNLQEQARKARYAALGRWAQQQGLEGILTAHHADDQAETLAMRLNRGSGLAGLAGIRASGLVEGCAVPVLRPLLGFRRKELRDLVEGAGVRFASDPSNADPSFDRVRMRRALAQADWLDVEAVGRSARLLDEVRAMVEAMALEDWHRNRQATQTGFAYAPFAASCVERKPVWIEVVRCVAKDLGRALSRSDAARLVDALRDGRKINIAGIMAEVEKSDQGRWLFEPEPPRRTG
ncbi:tRNA lysidine(34) synthetase TilS [Qipengyuania sp. 6B39]|nr:tRNA lysidine(34) synthetase TilS [Qipengyuania proteolytica]